MSWLTLRNCKELELSNEIFEDLGLDVILKTIDDRTVWREFKTRLLSPCHDLETIEWRREVMKDVISNPDIVRRSYLDLRELLDKRKRMYIGLLSTSPGSVVYESIKLLEFLISLLVKLREDFEGSKFSSRGFKALSSWLEKITDESTISRLRSILRELRFERGYSFRAKLSKGLKISKLKSIDHGKIGLVKRISRIWKTYSFVVNAGDEGALRVLHDIKELGLAGVARNVWKLSKGLLETVEGLEKELSFYIGALELYERLSSWGVSMVFPEFGNGISFSELRDVSLSILKEGKTVPNSLSLRNPVIVSGVNKGGKTTLLRSIGIAQLMAQSGIFVAAERYNTEIFDGIFTHFKGSEKKESSKLEEELTRFREILRVLRPGSLLLMNETLSSMNHVEASEMARSVIEILVECGIRVIFVTHLEDLVESMFDKAQILTPERLKNGKRTFRIIETRTKPESYAEDVYRSVFQRKTSDSNLSHGIRAS